MAEFHNRGPLQHDWCVGTEKSLRADLCTFREEKWRSTDQNFVSELQWAGGWPNRNIGIK